EEGENRFLEGYRKQFTHLYTTSHPGPLVLLDGEANDDDLQLAAQLAARFSQGKMADTVRVELHEKGATKRELDVTPLTNEEIPVEWYL
ncbi:Possible RNA methyltransferase aq_898, partial [hydrothermal vent metagenome]